MKNREQLIKEVAELKLKITDLYEELKTWMEENQSRYTCITLTKTYKSYWKSIMALDREKNNLQYQIELLDGKVWNNEKWATEFIGYSYDSLEDARTQLANLLSKMSGVEIRNDKGVRFVYITTKNKIYRYQLNGHYGAEIIGKEKVFNVWGKEEERPIYKNRFFAQLHPYKDESGSNWAWRNSLCE